MSDALEPTGTTEVPQAEPNGGRPAGDAAGGAEGEPVDYQALYEREKQAKEQLLRQKSNWERRQPEPAPPPPTGLPAADDLESEMIGYLALKKAADSGDIWAREQLRVRRELESMRLDVRLNAVPPAQREAVKELLLSGRVTDVGLAQEIVGRREPPKATGAPPAPKPDLHTTPVTATQAAERKASQSELLAKAGDRARPLEERKKLRDEYLKSRKVPEDY